MSRLLDNGTALPGPQYYSGPKNSSYIIPGVYDLTTEDTNWVLTSSFIIFTMVIYAYIENWSSYGISKLIFFILLCFTFVANRIRYAWSSKKINYYYFTLLFIINKHIFLLSGMLESGCVSVKNEVNIMMKNIVDIVLGGCKFFLYFYTHTRLAASRFILSYFSWSIV